MIRISKVIPLILTLTIVHSNNSFAQNLVDGELPIWGSFSGKIAYAGDKDLLKASLFSGTFVTFKIDSTGNHNSLQPKLGLKLGDKNIDIPNKFIEESSTSSYKIKDFPIEQSGTYYLQARGANDSTGEYVVTSKENFAEIYIAEKLLAPIEVLELTFPGRSGELVELVANNLSNSPSPFVSADSISLIAPDGALVELTNPQLLNQNTKIKFDPLELEQDGEYHYLMINPFPNQQKLRLRAKPLQWNTTGADMIEDQGNMSVGVSFGISGGAWADSTSIPEDSEFLSNEILIDTDSYNGTLPYKSIKKSNLSQILANFLNAKVVNEGGGISRLRRNGVSGAIVNGTNKDAVSDVVDLLEQAHAAGFKKVAPNFIRHEMSIPNDPLFADQWDIILPRFPEAVEIMPGDASRVVAVVDTGIRFEHPDLAGRLIGGYDFVSDAWNAGDGNGYDPDPTDPFTSAGTHGTHVTGTIAAVANNKIGIAGATRVGAVLPVRVLGVLGGSDFDIAQGVLYAAKLPNSSYQLPAIKAEAINLSLGGSAYSAILDKGIQSAISSGSVVIAAMGNSDSKKPIYPAALDNVISVGATTINDKRAYYSSYGKHIEISAPGGDLKHDLDNNGIADGVLSTIVSPISGPTWSLKHGTSMATPHVTAAAFLLRSLDPSLDARHVTALLSAGAVDLGAPGFDKFFGYGRLDAYQSLKILTQDLLTQEKQLFAFPYELGFKQGKEKELLTLLNQSASGPISIESILSDKFWVKVENIATTTPADFEITVDRQGLYPGNYFSNLTVNTETGPIQIPVNVEVVDPSKATAIKYIYLIAWDNTAKKVAGVSKIDSDSGEFAYIDGLPEGSYSFILTTDLDQDGTVAESHDFIGLAKSPNQDTSITIQNGDEPALFTVLIQNNPEKLPKGGNYLLE